MSKPGDSARQNGGTSGPRTPSPQASPPMSLSSFLVPQSVRTAMIPGPGPQPSLMQRPAVMGALAGGTVYGGVGALVGSMVVRNRLAEQSAARANPNPSSLAPRLSAMMAVGNNPPGSLGAGLESGIRAIHTMFGSSGQAHINRVFSSPEVQSLAGQAPGTARNPSAASRTVAGMEYGYWTNERAGRSSMVGGVSYPPSAMSGPTPMNRVATNFLPGLRASVQSAAAHVPELFPTLARVGVRAAATTGAGMAGALAFGAAGMAVEAMTDTMRAGTASESSRRR